MTTLLTASHRRCDGKCHHSPADRADRCRCICGGRLHGVGRNAVTRLVELLHTGTLPGDLVTEAHRHLPETALDDPLPGMPTDPRGTHD